MNKYYGHTLEGKGTEDWELLEDHLTLVAKYAVLFAEKFNSMDWAELLGPLHDLGKYDQRFQDYLLRENGHKAHLESASRVNHSSFGAQHVVAQIEETQKPLGYLLAYCIMGHHAGLPNYMDSNPEQGRLSSLSGRLKDESTLLNFDQFPEQYHKVATPSLPNIKIDQIVFPFQLAFFTRMLFSCLVDADYLATEEFMSPHKTTHRPKPFTKWNLLKDHLLGNLEQLKRPNRIGQIRDHILHSCLAAGNLEPGLFSLTVPTGGGKTLSSLAFALEHLISHNKDRIIYAIPFTSIIEQTADVFRNVFSEIDEEIVLEQHSNVDPDDEKYSSRLAAENWDAPLVVTTNVQLLESLFAAQPSRCRKLHRLTNSVILLDEAQSLPVEFLEPCLRALQELVTNYGCTIVFCTATQPAVNHRGNFEIGLTDIREIIEDPVALATRMRRTEIESLGLTGQEQLVVLMSKHMSFLCIVNTKSDAASIFQKLIDQSGTEGLFHLSTNLCAVHRGEKLREIRQRLQKGQPCKVISTQLIEAGVDVDFPVVFRSMAGLDSIAQAAGRCNREGKMETARVYVFEPEGEGWSRLRGYLKRVADITRQLVIDTDSALHKHGWLATQTIEQYFRRNYWSHSDLWDKRQILENFLIDRKSGTPQFAFRDAARQFRLIEDLQTTVFVRYDNTAESLLEELRSLLNDPDRKATGMRKRKILRKLQRYSVGVRDKDFNAMRGIDISEMLDDRNEPTGYFELLNPNCYDIELGFTPGQGGLIGDGIS